MGIFNDIASVDSFAINAYCIVSALFFSACAYAQLNDPNPVQWFCAYVFGGTVPNLYWITTSCGGDPSMTEKLVQAIRIFVILLGLAIVYKLVSVFPKLMEEVSEHHHGFLWAYMEHEEGRDSIGLLLLILHASYLRSVLTRGPSSSRRSPRNGSSSTGPAISPTLVAVGLFAVLGVSIYVWVVHHQELVAKHGLKHCQGEMFGRMGEL